MKLKSSKCRSIATVNGQVTDQRFDVGGTPIPTVAEMPVKAWEDGMMQSSKTQSS